MNSQNPDHRTPMLNPQYYDDTKLQRRTKFLVSGLLLCFVIGIASLGISIMILMKNQDLPDLIDYAKQAPQSQKIKEDLETANNEITNMKKEMKRMKITLATQSTQPQSVMETAKLKNELDMIDDPSENENAHSEHYGTHLHHGEHMDHGPFDNNLDLFFTNEGSGDQNDDDELESEDYFGEIGSGDALKCIVFPKPFCSEEHQICWTDHRCPVPFCCSSELTH